MRKKIGLSFMAFCLVVMLAGCSLLPSGPSVCDDKSSPSLLCDIADKSGIRLETVGNMIIIVNRVAILSGQYTNAHAATVLKNIRQAIENPVSYIFFKAVVENNIGKYPGLFDMASSYISEFISPDIMHRKDRFILISWLDNRIIDLEQ